MNPNFKTGFVSFVGKPNVGKSTLMNRLIGEKLSIITPKPQTTRQSVKGILTDENKQIIMLDTPGFLKPRYELQKRMMKYIEYALKDSDVIVFISDADKYPTDYDKDFLKILNKIRKPKIGVLNKIDTISEAAELTKVNHMKKQNFDELISISALNGTNTDELLKMIEKYLPEHPPFYSDENISDLPMRFFVQEIIREQIFLNYRDEIPYSSTTEVIDYKDKGNKVEIYANIWIERKSQKGIVIGENGKAISHLRRHTQKEIHKFVQKRVKLKLWVKIKDKWRKKKGALNEFGYKLRK